jgi:hypothetical protein
VREGNVRLASGRHESGWLVRRTARDDASAAIIGWERGSVRSLVKLIDNNYPKFTTGRHSHRREWRRCRPICVW